MIMSLKKFFTLLSFLALVLVACHKKRSDGKVVPGSSEDVKTFPAAKPNSYWKKALSPDSYEIMVNKGTEPAFHNPYWYIRKRCYR
jgi:peptide-methionine (R)-S-oxide reductase